MDFSRPADYPDMTITVDWDVNYQTKQKNNLGENSGLCKIHIVDDNEILTCDFFKLSAFRFKILPCNRKQARECSKLGITVLRISFGDS